MLSMDQPFELLPFSEMVVYQIYPRSFKDSSGDGVGDLKGITSKLDYLEWLGINAIWISPFYKSPMADFGYDVADYYKVDPLFGSMRDFDELLSEAHRRKIKVLLDFVPNHTSDRHAWFKESRASRESPKRDWYIWADPKPNGSPPNNWLSVFGGSAWEFDEKTGQYYMHSFLKEQPDLNWANPAVREAMKDAMHFWFDKGVDGFRVDAVYWMAKDAKLRDDPPNPNFKPHADNPYDSLQHEYSSRRPELYGYLKELARVAAEYKNRILVTEAYPEKRFNLAGYLDFYENVDPEHLVPFNFEGLHLPWDARAYKQYIDAFQAALKPNYCPVYVTGNHDKPRIATRIGYKASRAAALLLLSLPGMPFIYYGDEIGMENVPLKKHEIRDPFELNVPDRRLGRDPGRTPMQWAPVRHGGFSRVTPWLPLSNKHKSRDVESQSKDPSSILNLYRNLLYFRRASPTLKYGGYHAVASPHRDVYMFVREYEGEKLLIAINFSNKRLRKLPVKGTPIISTAGHKVPARALLPLEGRIIRLD